MSLIAAFVGTSRTVLLADSRVSTRGGYVADGSRKLFQAGSHTLCGIVGLAGFGGGDLFSTRVERLCAQENRPRELLCAIRDELCGPIAKYVAEDPEEFQWLLPDSEIIFAALAIRRNASGKSDLFELQLPIGQFEGKPFVGKPTILMKFEGLRLRRHQEMIPVKSVHGELLELWKKPLPPQRVTYWIGACDALEKYPDMLDPEGSDAHILTVSDYIVKASTDEETGGGLDVASIDSTGVRWLRRKKTEEENNHG
jgi:hypothetical protein